MRNCVVNLFQWQSYYPKAVNIFQYFLCMLLLQFLHHASFSAAPPDSYVGSLNAYKSNGQVFLTWQNVQNQTAYYKVYRSTIAITTGGQLLNSEYLGYTNSASSLDYDLSRHDGADRYFVIEAGSGPLNSSTGLFVATTLTNGSYYYAVTTVINGTEDLTLVPGANTLQNPVAETVSAPQPVFQQARLVGLKTIEIYTNFISSKYATNMPLMNKAGFIANDFILFRNNATSGKHPLRIRFHGGGGDFFLNSTAVQGDEININPEHFLPGGKNAYWWGANENFNILNADSNETSPVDGVNYDFSQQQITRIINWAIASLPVDSDRIYLEGSSMGSIGAYFFALRYPERIAAVKLSGSVFDLSFQEDFYPGCTLNEGNMNRLDGDRQFGKVSANLLANSGLHFFDQLNGNWYTGIYKEKDYPVIYSINGKNDTVVGWTEKTIYYGTLNVTHIGGYYFWDRRKHGGGALTTWSDENFNIFRYRRNLSFPAFANCSTNEDYGNGSAASGEDYGTVNGFLDWTDKIIDSTTHWQVKVFLRDLDKINGTEVAPAFCTVDVTPRRMQLFKMEPGDVADWLVEYNGSVIQSGTAAFEVGILTIPEVMVYKDTITLTVTHAASEDTIDRNISGVAIIPNIFEGNTTIHWIMPEQGRCDISVYDFQGRYVKTLLAGESGIGLHQLTWPGDDMQGDSVKSGIYFIRLRTVYTTEVKKCIIAR